MKQLIRSWMCMVRGHDMQLDGRIRLVRLTDDPFIEFIDGLPAGAGTRCTGCGLYGVDQSKPTYKSYGAKL